MRSNLLGFAILVAWLKLGAGATAAERLPVLTEDQIRQLIRQVAEKDQENDKKERDYTYVERDEERTLDGKRHVKSTETRTYEVMDLYGDQVQRLIAKDDKPLSDQDARKEEKKIQKLIAIAKRDNPALLSAIVPSLKDKNEIVRYEAAAVLRLSSAQSSSSRQKATTASSIQ